MAVKFLIVGRTATGKDTLQDILSIRFGWKSVKSFTTRPKRFPDEDTHIFVTQTDADSILQNEKAAWTSINGYEYFSTKEQVEECDDYIIDPHGLKLLLTNMPDERFCIVYIFPSDKTMQKNNAVRRSCNPEAEAEIFAQRSSSENYQFTEFEAALSRPESFPENCVNFVRFVNHYRIDEIERLAVELEALRKTIK